MKPSGSQRRAPLTLMPTCGTSTRIRSSSDDTKIHGAARSQVRIGTWKVRRPAMVAITSEAMWRVMKKLGL